MARKIALTRTVPKAHKNIWYVNDRCPVGRGKDSNLWRADVQLIQYFLHIFFTVHPKLLNKLPSTGGGYTPFALDGKCGPRTIKAIEVFQGCFAANLRLAKDGRVSVARGVGYPNFYTIFGLNMWYQDDTWDFKPENLEDDPVIQHCAPELYQDLLLSKDAVEIDW